MAGPYLFLRKDFDCLNRRIGDINDDISEIGTEMVTRATEGAETSHDSSGIEEGQRQEDMLARRAENFEKIRADAELVTAGSSEVVSVGSRVALETQDGERRDFIVGSYWILDRRAPEEVSYEAPVIAPFMGARVGEERSVTINGEERTWRVTAIDAVEPG